MMRRVFKRASGARLSLGTVRGLSGSARYLRRDHAWSRIAMRWRRPRRRPTSRPVERNLVLPAVEPRAQRTPAAGITLRQLNATPQRMVLHRKRRATALRQRHDMNRDAPPREKMSTVAAPQLAGKRGSQLRRALSHGTLSNIVTAAAPGSSTAPRASPVCRERFVARALLGTPPAIREFRIPVGASPSQQQHRVPYARVPSAVPPPRSRKLATQRVFRATPSPPGASRRPDLRESRGQAPVGVALDLVWRKHVGGEAGVDARSAGRPRELAAEASTATTLRHSAATAAVDAPAAPEPRRADVTSLDPIFVDRLTDDVIRRVERRMRIERERRGV
jgi:hypothetical protein